MLIAVLQFLASAAVIVVAGTFLTKFADEIAELTGLGRLLVGSVLLAGATSLPELSVDISAVRLGETDMAVGDLMGSSLFNLLILGVLDSMHRRPTRILSRASASHALPATLSIALTAIAAIAIVINTRAGVSLAGLSLGSWALLAFYIAGVRVVYLDQRITAAIVEAEQSTTDESHGTSKRVRLIRAVLGFAAASGVILLAAPFMAEAAAKIADESGLGGTFVGTTLVALSTSLPELVASLSALRMGAFDMAVGNVFGSNAFNMLLLVVLDVFQPGPMFAIISTAHVLTALSAILVTSIAVLGQLYHTEERLLFLEPDGALIILLVVATLALLYFAG
ncbi:MAG: hypothetical protein SFX72_01625 [Isosphaeraceae bacterium]|nr:hypothetical protein [Isosphaeraceae bacterium]